MVLGLKGSDIVGLNHVGGGGGSSSNAIFIFFHSVQLLVGKQGSSHFV